MEDKVGLTLACLNIKKLVKMMTNVDLSLQPVLRVVCGASVAHQCDGTHVWRHGLIMVEFDVSGHGKDE